MFRCEQCQQVIGSGIPQHRVTTVLRRRVYPWPKDTKEDFKRLPPPEGWEIARELKLCGPCAESHHPTPTGVSAFVKYLSKPDAPRMSPAAYPREAEMDKAS